MTQEMGEKEEAVESIMDSLEKHKVSTEQEREWEWRIIMEIYSNTILQTAVIMERKKREQLRKALGKLQEEMKQQVRIQSLK